MEKPRDIPSIFTKNKSSEIMSGFKLENKKKKVTRSINKMK